MKYYCVSDVHAHYQQLIDVLSQNGYFDDTGPHKLVVLGDLFDRGPEPQKLQDFILQQMDQGNIILIKGNHESLFQSFAAIDGAQPLFHHVANGTFQTALALTGYTQQDALRQNDDFAKAVRETALYSKIIPAMQDYYETPHYIFVHGWIPSQKYFGHYIPLEDWREASAPMWEKARWIKGMDAVSTVYEKEKTIVCGHWHASYGHSRDGIGSEFGDDAEWNPYYDNGIIAIDACTIHSGKMNCLVIDD